ncbi:MAG: hypothetical protein ACYTEW_25685, partial [Planctomycetota bacterium]
YREEIIQVWTDGTELNKARRLAHHRSLRTSYWASPRAAASMDGKFVMWSSDWEGSGYIDVFILKIPDEFQAKSAPPGKGNKQPKGRGKK